jgi:hypothetical protein
MTMRWPDEAGQSGPDRGHEHAHVIQRTVLVEAERTLAIPKKEAKKGQNAELGSDENPSE